MPKDLKTTSDLIRLSSTQERNFRQALKIGLYKELYRKNLLNDVQLNLLLKLQKE